MEKDPNSLPVEREVKRFRRTLSCPLENARGTYREKTGYLLRERWPGEGWRYAEASPLGTISREEAADLKLLRSWQENQARSVRALAEHPVFGFALWCLANDGAPTDGADRRVSCSSLLPAGAGALEKMPSLLRQGYLTFKWKVGVHEAAEEIRMAEKLFSAAPAEVTFRLDANRSWSEAEARLWAGALRGAPVDYVEEPLWPGKDQEMLKLASNYPVPLALDERLRERDNGVAWWQSRNWPGFYVIKPSLSGPVDRWWKPLRAKGELSRVILSSALETAIGGRHLLKLASALPGERSHGLGVGEAFAGESPYMGLPEKANLSVSCLDETLIPTVWKEAEPL
ncbi:MAG: o-succinylbenzoate synthase [Opitutales bacterium]|nr:o-succinylbenzoate synthase [Opitutales bacterium]MCH8539930.1 o-succinylbenzoate synthase [Opitutales bacterium]